MRSFLVRSVALALTMALGAAGAAAAAPSAPKPTGTPLIVGWIGDTSSPQGQTGQETRAAVLAWAKWVNAHGGINGHPVKVIARDVGIDNAKALETVRDLVENEHVIAFVGDAASATDTAYLQYLDDHQIPLVGGQAYSAARASRRFFFPASTTIPSVVWMQLFAAKFAGAKKTGLFWCSSNPACANAVALYNRYADENGVELTFDQKLDDSASDQTAPCLASQGKDVEALFIAAAANVGTRVIQSCLRQHYKPSFVIPASAFSGTLLQVSKSGGAHFVIPSDTFLWFLKRGAAYKEHVKAIAKYAKGTPLGPPEALGWVSGKLFEAAAANVPDNPTAADIINGLYALHDETLGGLSPQALTYTQGKPAQVLCFFLAEVKKGKLSAPQSTKTECQPPA